MWQEKRLRNEVQNLFKEYNLTPTSCNLSEMVDSKAITGLPSELVEKELGERIGALNKPKPPCIEELRILYTLRMLKC